MERFSIRRAAALLALLGSTLSLVAACSSTDAPAKPPGGPPAGKGYCQDTCDKDCSSDSDCETSQGDLCCDLGSAGKTCLPARACPKHCSGDSSCDVKNGEVCAKVSLSIPDKLCVAPAQALHTCTADSN